MSHYCYRYRMAVFLILVRPVIRCNAFRSASVSVLLQPKASSDKHRFRRTRSYHPSNSGGAEQDNKSTLAKDAFSRLARRGKSWKRLRHLVDFAVEEDQNSRHAIQNQWRGIADVGTDHGLLAVGLAITGRFEKVVGIDVSEKAMTNGAFKLQREILLHEKHAVPALEFRKGNGLLALQRGEADTVCIAGMGVHTMIEILTARRNATRNLILDDLECQRLILQPTNSKPRHLINLLKSLNDIGWSLDDERIEYLSSRWYLSLTIGREAGADDHLPGLYLAASSDSKMRQLFHAWVDHHRTWILADMEKGPVPQEELRWLKEFEQLRIEPQ